MRRSKFWRNEGYCSSFINEVPSVHIIFSTDQPSWEPGRSSINAVRSLNQWISMPGNCISKNWITAQNQPSCSVDSSAALDSVALLWGMQTSRCNPLRSWIIARHKPEETASHMDKKKCYVITIVMPNSKLSIHVLIIIQVRIPCTCTGTSFEWALGK